jgi:hypothetical protein
MKGVALEWVAILSLVSGLTALGSAEEPVATDNDRVSANFTREAATVGDGNVRVELRGLRVEDQGNPGLNVIGLPIGDEADAVNGGTIDLLGSYGLAKGMEVGGDLPVVVQKMSLKTGHTSNDADVGDLLLYGKLKRQVAEHCAAAGGLELSLPTGPESKGFGTGEVGMNPFLSTRYQRGRFAVGAHVGYQINTGQVVDVFNYSAIVIVRANENVSFRTEISGREFKTGGSDYHDLSVLPGIDVSVSKRFSIRPTALAGLTDDSMDWGIGLGLALQL